MNKKTTAFLSTTITYSLLFYHQNAGLNYLLFDFVLIFFCIYVWPSALKKYSFHFSALLLVICGIGVLMHNSNWAIMMNIISGLILSLDAGTAGKTPWVNFFHAIFSQVSCFIFYVIEKFERKKNSNSSPSKKKYVGIIQFLIIITISLIFLLLYKNSNPVFAEYTKFINLDWLSLEWLLFTLGGFLLLYPFFTPRKIQTVIELDYLSTNILKEQKNFWNLFDASREKLTVLLLFSLLNLMLFVLNGIDIYYLYFNHSLPQGLNHSDFVHEGVNSLILSIIFGSIILIYAFRAELNFSENSGVIKFLSLLWIVQNIFLVSSTFIRNHIYIEEFQLTYKRLGVFIYLIMACIGLISMSIKIIKGKNFHFLLRLNSWALYVLFCAFSLIDIDRFITTFNISHSNNNVEIDKWYLCNLDGNNTDLLSELKANGKFNENLIKKSAQTDIMRFESVPYQYTNNEQILDKKIFNFLKDYDENDFRSLSMRSATTIQNLRKLSATGIVTTFNFSQTYNNDIHALRKLPLVLKLNLSSCNFTNLWSLGQFSELIELNLSNNYISNIDSLPYLKKLIELDLSGNALINIHQINRCPSLRKLNLNRCQLKKLPQFYSSSPIQDLQLSENNIVNFHELKYLKKLQSLELNSLQTYSGPLPQINNLRKLSFCFNQDRNASKFLRLSLLNNPQIQNLTISNNNWLNVEFLENNKNVAALPNLKILDCSNNRVMQLSFLANYETIKSIQVQHNNLKSLCGIEKNSELESLDASDNNLISVYCLNNLKELRFLNLSNNAELTDLTVLAELKQIVNLNIQNTNVTSLEFLKECIKLEQLNIIGCPIKSNFILGSLQNLKEISLTDVNNENIKDLLKIKNLKIIHTQNIAPYFKKQLESKGIKINII